jgi:hypothetical protein
VGSDNSFFHVLSCDDGDLSLSSFGGEGGERGVEFVSVVLLCVGLVGVLIVRSIVGVVFCFGTAFAEPV